jgi:murein DD-endopeptidase MepM/ murein hydrolase activator NlpD
MHLVRMQVIRLLVAAAVLAAAAPEGWSVAAGRLHLPLAGAPCPTSSFGSRRTSHIHAGVDFSTGGRTGVPVLAVDTCFVWRVSVKNGGYGRALYVVLPDGQVAVYGHLDRFAGPIEKMVVEEQNQQGAYEVELYPGPNAFRFMPGDTVAFSGETGAGPPHLHFELRSGRTDFDNLSPVPSRLDLREDSPPVIKRVRIVPLGPAGRPARDHCHRGLRGRGVRHRRGALRARDLADLL